MKRPDGVCKDCWAEYLLAQDDDPAYPLPRWRPAPKPGPRCVTHDRAEKTRRKARAHGLKVESGFGIPAEVYWALYEFQGGRCAILRCRATGKTRRLAVDHDHKCCPGRTSCGKCVRGLICQVHNEQLGRNGDDPEVFMDMAGYLKFPSYLQYLWTRAGRTVPSSQVLREMAAKQTRDSFELERGAQSEQLDGDTGAGTVEQ